MAKKRTKKMTKKSGLVKARCVWKNMSKGLSKKESRVKCNVKGPK